MNKFNPLTFLASLGAGGIAVAPFVYFQYAVPHGKGLTTFSQVMSNASSSFSKSMFALMIGVMIVFALIHLSLTVKLTIDLFRWRKTDDFKSFIGDPQRNTTIMAAFTSIAMTFNVFIGVIRFFIPALQNNFQALMLPALIAWGILWFLVMRTEIIILKSAFEKDFDISKLSFGWLMQPFALGMLTVAGTGIAAMAHAPAISHIAAFLALTSGSMGMFLLLVKLISVFKSHFSMKGVPERQFLPGFLIVIPITTIYAISMFRLGHYMEHQFDIHLQAYYILVIAIPFAFQTWYFAFGLSMLKDYFKKDFFRKEYYVTLWAFICPFVGYAVLGTFFYKFTVANNFVIAIIFSSIILAVLFYSYVSIRYFKYMYPVIKTQSVSQLT
ncbi:MAG: hypothetical protein MI922_22915 [Bacteroidales bacterium]|nr:hypothetical protein [Bacteroidales bacterium]